MKNRVNWLVIPAVALSLGACKKKEEIKTPGEPTAVEAPAEKPAPAETTPETSALSPEERAAKLGFAKHLPQETEVLLAVHNGSKTAERVKSSKLWKLLSQDDMGDMAPEDDIEMGEDDFEMPEGEQDAAAEAPEEEAAAAAEEPFGPAALFGTEFSIAMGKTAGEQFANLLTVNRRMGYFQMRQLAKAFVESAKSGDFSTVEEAFSEQYGEEVFTGLLNDPQSGMDLFDKMNMPPLYFAFRTSEGNREPAAQQISQLVSNLGMMGEMVEPAETEQAGQKFAGYKISGAKVSEMMAAEREDMEESLDPATVDKLLAAIAKKNLVILSGTIGDYVLLFLGSSTDDLILAQELNQSMVAGDSLAFTDAYAAKELAAVIYGKEEALERMMIAAGGLGDMASGLRDGLAGSEGIGDTRDLEALLQMVGERESALRKLAKHQGLGTIAFFDEGLKIECFGGTDSGAVDWKATNKLAALGNSPDVAVFANMTSDAAYDEKARAYFEAIFETLYAMTMKVSEVETTDENMVQFKQMAGMFDTKFRPDVIAMWDACRGNFGGGLGQESAFIMDLNGTVPAIPGLPQPVVDEGKFPRISIVAPVTDRAKLADAWQKLNVSTTNILKNVSELTGQQIPMQKPISSEKDGFTTWFFSMPFFNDDFMPSVTVGDEWFAASTSKNQSLDLLAKAAAGGETSTGLSFVVNFKALQTFATTTLDVLEKNPDALPMGSEEKENVRKVTQAMDDLDQLKVHVRRDQGQLRSSIHFKTR